MRPFYYILPLCLVCSCVSLWLVWGRLSLHSASQPQQSCDYRWRDFMSDHLDKVQLGIEASKKADKELVSKYHRDRKKCEPNGKVTNMPNSLEQRLSFFEPNMTSRRFNDSRILILTPVKSAANSAQRYFTLINSLDYPHRLISVAVGVDPSSSSSLSAYKNSSTIAQGFKNINVFKLNTKSHNVGNSWTMIHREYVQRWRRESIARARNELLYRSMSDDIDYIMWVDSDVKSWPTDVIQHLISSKQDVVVPACMWRNSRGNLSLYDRNSWQETDGSLSQQKLLTEDRLILEGYSRSLRLYLTDLRNDTRIVPLDGVGGCVLVIKSSCHREGLNFPTFIFNHHIETEGLAKMAIKMGYSVCGLPYLQVIHS